LPSLPGIIIKAACIPSRFPLFSHVRLVADHTGLQIFQAFFTLAVLPFEAISNLDAIIRTCWRTLISRRKLLQWTSSGTIKLEEGKHVWGYFHLMAAAPIIVTLLGLFMVITGVHCGYDVWCMLGIWFFSPVVSWWISKPFVPREPAISATQYSYLRKIARKTWSYFETFASAEENYLPADNYQEEPVETVAHRTSPTNIGLMLLSNLGAYDIGYLCAGQLIDKTTKTFKTMANMTRFKGHFFNWYDTKTLAPLAPQYVSTVDSGNLAGYLLTLRIGLLQIKDQAVFQEQSFAGLTDTLSVLKEQIRPLIKKKPELAEHLNSLDTALLSAQKKPSGLSATLRSISSIKDQFICLRTMIENDDTSKPEITRWLTVFETHCTVLLEELQYCAPWLTIDMSIDDSPMLQELDNNWTLAQLALLNESLLSGSIQKGKSDDAMQQSVVLGSTRAQERIRQLDILAEECKELSDQDYEFLYDHSRNLLVIGYDVTNRRRDSGYYDLLASEARLGSFIGIASGKLPVEHWFRLGRLITIRRGKTVLLSWGGSMFEYLMPQLVMPGYDQTLLGQTCKAVVDWQIDYCSKQGVPWGISESAENLIDASMNYQYRSFGVPGLGFKRDLADDLVISPYASVLALIARPQDACRNMERLSNDGYEGRYGFYEAIDFEATSQSSVIRHPFLIRSFMAHHQGMSFVSLVNFIAGNPMPRRFESDPLFRTTTLLLQERIPVVSPFKIISSDYLETRVIHPGQDDQLRSFATPHTAVPEVRLMSNSRYHVMVTAAGGGYSRWLDYAVTRWNEDVTMDNCGMFIYINDLSTQHKWSATFQPLGIEPKSYQAIFPPARAEFRRHDSGLDTFTEIAVSSEDDIECRRITINNFTSKSRNIELTSYAEVVLVPPAADASHPAFSNLFMQTEIVQSKHAILCSRRPRSPHEKCPWMFHLITVQGLENYEMSYETDRLAFIGRGRTPATPRAMDSGGVLSNTDGAVLDPIVSIRCRFTLKEGETVTLCFISGMALSRAEAEALIEKYQDQQLADRVFNLAVIHGKVVLQQLNATESDALLYDKLASSIIYASKYLRANPAILLKNARGQSNLWAYSLSGDLPIVLLRVGDSSRLELVAKMIQAHAYWRLKGLAVDLVIWNEEQVGYRQALNNQIVSLIAASSEASLFDKAGGVYLRHQEQMSDEDQVLMQAVARLIFTDKNGSLVEQCQRYFRGEPPVQKLVVSRHERVLQSLDYFRQDNLLFFNGWGGFTRDGREYVIQTRQSNPTPMPWVNVVANKQFGTVISQSGGYTWFENAHEFRLTPWYNDPVTDRCGEALYLRDEESGQFWSATPGPAPGSNDYLNRHGFGYSVFEYMQNKIKSELWIYVDVEAPVKFWLLKVRNDALLTRRLSITGFIELVLGENRSKTLMHVRTGIDSKTGAILASNPFNTEFAGRTVFFDVNEAYRTVSGDRTEFIGRNGSLTNPAALHNARLSGRVGVGLDPAAALQVPFELAPGQEKDIVFILGAGRDIEDARNLINRFNGLQAAYNARERVWQHWNHTLGAVNIETPDPALNLIANGWLIYQTMSSRLWGRSGYYQSGGAFGYRDQLQDVMALTHTRPDLVREHLLLCASRQFSIGDVQHWWHPPQGRGVRTLISDDYLWLPLVTSDYVTRTGDTGVLDEPLNFLDGRHLNPDEESYYDLPARSSEKVTLYEHCKRAILHGLRYGSHGLPLMGSGDWNDGMNLVGVKGDGESVWLAFFLCYVLKQFTSIAQLHDDASFAVRCSEEISKLKENINSSTWDGSWYLRAFCDDGTILGTSHNDECRIDAIVQSWAVLSGAGDPEKSKQAMSSLERILIDKKNKIIKLLDPPFDKSALEPGYIKGYVPGIRENGGQYTHAAVWAIMAFAAMGEKEKVKDLLSLINPVNHGSTPELISRYLVEPYVIAADIYGAAPHTGRGGWTWYTGSASWMYRLILESVLGLQLNANVLTFTPCIPESWKKLTIHYRFKETVYHIEYNQITPGNVVSVLVDGTKQSDVAVHLCNDQIEHYISILINNA